MATVSVKVSELRALITRRLRQLGHSARDAQVISAVLLYAEERQNSQGVAKLLGDACRRAPDAVAPLLRRRSAVSGVVDGGRSFGMVATVYATDAAIAMAERSGVALVGVRNIASSTGAIGYYAARIAQRGLVAIVMASSPPLTAPYGSTSPRFGTNPIAFGLPSANGENVVLDIGTSIVSYYALVKAAANGEQVGENIGFDKAGAPTTDPGKIMNGALRSFARGPASSGLAMMVESLAGGLVGAGLDLEDGNAPDKFHDNWGQLIIAFKPEILAQSRDSYLASVQRLMERVRSAQANANEGHSAVLTPGQRGAQRAAKVRATGKLEMSAAIVNKLRQEVQKAKL